jgi:multidrug efflux pump subunit AcrB
MSLAVWLHSHRRTVLAAAGASVVGGLVAITTLPVGLFPRTTFPRVVVSIESGDRPADRMAIEVTRPIEEAARGVPGVRNVRSTTSRGACDVSIDFSWGLDMAAATLQVQSAIARILPSLPAGTAFEARRMDPTVFPVIGLSLTPSQGQSLVELRDRALYDLAPRLSSIEGVASVGVQGGRTAEIQVLVDPERLDAVGLGFEEVLRVLAASNVVEAVGRLEQDEKLYLVLSATEARRPEQIGQIVVRRGANGFVRVADVADVRLATAPEWTRVTADGAEAVLVTIYQQPDGNTLQISADVAERLRRYQAEALGAPRVATWYDQSELIRTSARSVRDAVLLGGALAILVLAGFLGSWRVTLVVALVAPAVLVVAILLLAAFGATMNIMTLGGLAASVGLVIDDAIVMVERLVSRHRSGAADDGVGLLAGAREMLLPLTASSFVTCVIFVPLAWLSGVAGAFFRPLALTVAVTLVVSYVFTLLVVPLVASALLRSSDPASRDVGPRLERILDRYERLLRWLLPRPRACFGAVAAAAALGAVAFTRLGTGFLPTLDEGGFVVDYRAPAGTSLAETDRRLREVERILAETPEVDTFSRRTGLALGGFVTEANEGDFFARLRPPPRRPIGEVIDDVRSRIEGEVPGLEVELPQLVEDLIGDLTAVPQPIEVKIFGADPEQLRRIADELAQGLRGVRGVVDVKSGVILAGDAIRIEVDRTRAAGLGLDPEQVTRFAKAALEGEVATQVQEPEKMVGVRVWTRPDARKRLDQLGRLRLTSSDGAAIALGRIARFHEDVGEPQITRENLKTMVAVTARIDGRDLGSAMRDVRAAVATHELPAGVYVEYGGTYREQQASFRSLVGVLGAASFLVALALLAFYESVSALLAVAAVGVVVASAVMVGLFVTRSDLNVSSLMGLTMTIGVSSEAAVFLLSQWRESRARLGSADALLEAGRLRFRPIAMTGAAAALGLLPLAIGLGRGSAMLQPLAIAIVSGLVATVPAVLLLLPPLLARFERLRRRL